MTRTVILFFALFFSAALAYEAIWELTGGNARGVGEGYNIRTEKRTGYPLVKFTRSDESILVNGQRYAIPDEVFGLGVMSIKNDSEVVILESYEDYQSMKQKMWGVSVGLTLYGVGVEASFSKLRGQIRGLTKNNSRAFNVASYMWHAFDLELDWRDAQLDDYFVADVKSLPASYDRAAYRRFIEAYGTHFFDKVGYGCKWNYTIAFDRDMMQKNKADWTKSQVGIGITFGMGSFGFKIGMDFGKFKNTSKLDGEFVKHSNGQEDLLGGDEMLQGKGLETWYPTCVKNRAILLEKSKLKPIAELFRDNARKQAMITALKDYAKHP